MSNQVQNELMHYGILGMHWGRKRSGNSGIKSKTQKLVKSGIKTVKDHADYIEKNKLKVKKISEMSNDEIMKLTRRINLEKQVKDLRPNKIKQGLNIVKNITAAGTTVASLYALSTTPLGSKIIDIVKKKVG
jgi:hypothetical protein